jgi:hypothetical protein
VFPKTVLIGVVLETSDPKRSHVFSFVSVCAGRGREQRHQIKAIARSLKIFMAVCGAHFSVPTGSDASVVCVSE